ncbi:oligopeptide/dipeptide ABC transporter ATP-binding protein [Candidatus Thiothrix sp. Deng01]|uniref:Oligopeptide/dipeptide ABC transporter ATP-binding protein n=1 Tax=Candidatus Thiothrix phosphatis TaxID=3112415 RepID=A0ABU6D190_9GAMM|nr:oligopeptide/dipeptide ABC transporter ATP-binding protein [Candidatus Thiothrix sp. Deng01]MEB4592843.1 oligopeptide/dipeptide ABC transporter ATP-binding protein [Candidatus Thiothrix sp. Deng01]
MDSPLLAVNHLGVRFRLKTGQTLQALTDVSLTLQAGETLGVVGESGCGKSTLARAILQLVAPAQGEIHWLGKLLDPHDRVGMKAFRRAVQCIFQDPLDALNPRMTVGNSIQEPLLALRPELGKAAIRQRADELLQAVGLESGMRNRYPHEFSGGQCQRIGIARALSVEPQLILCDEPVSALDVSIQRQIVKLLAGLQRERQLALLFISHDLGVVRELSDRVLVLYLGRIMEVADAESLYATPLHPYTRMLLAAVPLADPQQERERLAKVKVGAGELPSPLNPPSGCVFHTRCLQAQGVCREQAPQLREAGGRQVACHFA